MQAEEGLHATENRKD